MGAPPYSNYIGPPVHFESTFVAKAQKECFLAAALRRARSHNEGKISSAHPRFFKGLDGAERLGEGGRMEDRSRFCQVAERKRELIINN